jgi:hypothetical protein
LKLRYERKKPNDTRRNGNRFRIQQKDKRMSKGINEIGNTYSRLKVVASAGKNKNSELQWECRCDCGNKAIVLGYRLRNGRTRSCGCLARDIKKSD